MDAREITLTGGIWRDVMDVFYTTFIKTQWDIFRLATSIGILYDTQMDASEMGSDPKKEVEGKEPGNIPHSVVSRNINELTYMFQTAILTTTCIDLSNTDRLYLAFAEDVKEDDLEKDEKEELVKGVSEEALSFDALSFLKKYANFGAKKLSEQIAKNPRLTMESLAGFLEDSYNMNTPELIEKYRPQDIEE